MLMIRLARFGAKKKPTYRVVVIDKERARNSSNVEVLGHYNPLTAQKAMVINHDRVNYWIKCGAKPSATVARLLKANPAPPPAAPAE
jgi:small subunit ribosomal protein S16